MRVRKAVTYRERAAQGVMQRCHEVGVILVTFGGGLRGYPRSRLEKFPGLMFLCGRYKPELMELLDGTVE